MRIALAVAGSCAILAASAAQTPDPADGGVSVASLLRGLTDPALLSLHRHWTSRLDSSYDRSGGNKDQQQFLAVDGDTALLADLHGPGALVRIWTTSVTKVGDHLTSFQGGIFKIWIDDQPTPVIDMPFGVLFKGGQQPFVAPLTAINGSAYYTYLPIPYAKHCRITIDKPAAEFFYQINSIGFPEGTTVRPFTLPLSDEDAKALGEAQARWSEADVPAPGNASHFTTKLTIAAGGQERVLPILGPATIQSFTLAAPGVSDAGLRRLVLRCWFDDHHVPDIEAPVADFFGNAYGRKVFTSLFLAQNAAGEMTCRLPMPFATLARFTIENGNPEAVTVDLAMAYVPGPIPVGSLSLRADFNQEITARGKAHTWARIAGQAGHFVGVVQAMQSGRTLGFCEGDDQIRVDAETFTPSAKFPTVIAPWNGTGTEDCFNSAWYYSEGMKALPLSACLIKQDFGRIDTFRFFLDDAPVFQQSLDAQIENGGTNDSAGDYYSSVVFWYGTGERVPIAPMPAATTLGFPKIAYRGAPIVIEGESLAAGATATGGAVRAQDMAGLQNVWSDDRQLLWTGGAAKDALSVTFAVAKAGDYMLSIMAARGPGYGAATFAVNGEAMKRNFDGYNPELQNFGLVDLGVVTLPAGESKLTVTLSGKNGRATGTDFGLDLIALRQEAKAKTKVP